MDLAPDEYALALRAREGDRKALEELVERTRLQLFALAYAELRHYDDAHDAVAAALLQVCRSITELREPARVRAWMQAIVRNACRRLRQRRDVAALPLEEADAGSEYRRSAPRRSRPEPSGVSEGASSSRAARRAPSW